MKTPVRTLGILLLTQAILALGGALAGLFLSIGMGFVMLTWEPIYWGWPIGAGIGALLGLLPFYAHFRNSREPSA
jgi:hypothetical protein